MNKKIIFILIIAIVFQVGCNSGHARKDISKPIIAADTIASAGRAASNTRYQNGLFMFSMPFN